MNCKYCGSKLVCPTCGEERDWNDLDEELIESEDEKEQTMEVVEYDRFGIGTDENE